MNFIPLKRHARFLVSQDAVYHDTPPPAFFVADSDALIGALFFGVVTFENVFILYTKRETK